MTITKVADQTTLAAVFGVQNFLPHVKYLVLGTFTSSGVVGSSGLRRLHAHRERRLHRRAAGQRRAGDHPLLARAAERRRTGAGGVRAARARIVARRHPPARRSARESGLGQPRLRHQLPRRALGLRRRRRLHAHAGLVDPFACTSPPSAATPADCRPTTSGQGYVDPANLFTGRANGSSTSPTPRSSLRISATPATRNSLPAASPPSRPGDAAPRPVEARFLGQSLGAINGAVFLAAAPEPKVGVFNVGGGHLFEILSASPAFSPSSTCSSPPSASPAAPPPTPSSPPPPTGSSIPPTHGRSRPGLADTPVIVQEAGNDMVILPPFEAALAHAIFGADGLDAAGHAQGKTARRRDRLHVLPRREPRRNL